MFSMMHRVRQFGIPLCLAIVALVGSSQGAQAPPTADRTNALVKAATEQFQLAYRMNPSEAKRRQEQLSSVVAAWRAAPRDSANNELLTTWLRTAIRSSMPGSSEALPPVPMFAAATPVERTVNVAKPVVKESKSSVLEPAVKEVKSVAQATSATELKTPEPTPAVDMSDQALDAALADPFRDDPEDDQTK
jgi:hypothetical protein